MANRRTKRDILNSHRRRSGVDPRWVAGALVGLGIFGLVFFLFSGGDEEEAQAEVGDDIALAFAEAWTRVDAGVGLAQEFVESGQAEAELREQRQQEALTAEWVEGQAVLIAGELKERESLYLALMNRNVPDPAIHRVVTAIDEVYNLRRSRPGDKWEAQVNEEGVVEELRYETSPEDIFVTRLDEEGAYVSEELEIEVEVRQRKIAGDVEGSFWLSVERAGISGVVAHRFMRVFEYTIDFNTETRNGDTFAMVIEEIYLDGELLRYGRVLGAVYIGEYGTRQAYYFEAEEESGYFDEEGDSMQRMFLRSPLSVTRVTSNFGRRVHPITGDSRMHRGVDYGAPVGTPVQAVADGRVHFAGWRGGYGNLLILRHSGGYETRYAHLNSFGSGIRQGARVRQGQVVAQSGNTGNTTGPHLHYEMLRNGRHIDPLRVEATSGDPLKGEELSTFMAKHVGPLSEQLRQVLSQEVPTAVSAFDGLDDEEGPALSAED